MMIAIAEVPKDKDLLKAKDVLIQQLESICNDGIDDSDVQRAVRSIIKRRERGFANTERFATSLSEWESYGDWRLYFLHRDRLEKVTTDEVKAIAKQYLIQSNRTVGLFYPTDKAVRVDIEAKNNVKKMVADYKGREKLAEGEAFDPSPENIQKRTVFGELDSGMKYALLAKQTRGDRVTLSAKLHYGDEESLKGKTVAAELLPDLMERGTTQLGFQEYRDKLDELKATLSLSGSIGELTINLQTERDNLIPALDILRQALREPALEESEMEVLRDREKTELESGLSEPMTLAFKEFSRRLDPQPADDVRYTPTIEEELERINAVTIQNVVSLHKDFLGGQYGEIAVVGDFDSDATLAKLNEVFGGWKNNRPYKRIEEPANTSVKGERVNIDTPDKANAVYIAGIMTQVCENHPEFEAMTIGNYIMGGGPLSSRIADRVRKQDGLSYTAATRFRGDSEDQRGMYMMFCISNPTNTEKVVETVREEVDRMLASGVTGDELAKAKESYLTNRKGNRANDSRLASTLLTNLKTGRTMQFQQDGDERFSTLTKEQVDAAMKKVIDLERLTVITAGDFSKSESAPKTETKDTSDKN
jgi:zinc protease